MLWNNGIDLTVKSFSSSHINVEIRLRNVVWGLIGFYGYSNVPDRSLG